MKKILAIAIVVVMLLGAIACSSEPNKMFGIGTSSSGESHSYSAGEAVDFFSGMIIDAHGISESQGVSYAYSFHSDNGKIYGVGEDSLGNQYTFEFYLNGMNPEG